MVIGKGRLQHISLLIAIVVGLGGLVTGVISLIVTYQTYNLSQNIAEQSYAQKTVLVARGNQAYVQNYGTLPIWNVEVVAFPYTSSPIVDKEHPAEVDFSIGTIPPCSQVDISDWFGLIVPKSYHNFYIRIRLTDINGIRWLRAATGTPTQIRNDKLKFSSDEPLTPIEALAKCA